VWFPIAALAAIGLPLLPGSAARLRPGDPLPRRHVVEMRGMAFHPAVLEVQPGDTVVWINRDIVPHTATASGKAGWTTGALAQGQSGRYVPRKRGEEPYACELHPTMRGKLIVIAQSR
jgi:plastocyanin